MKTGAYLGDGNDNRNIDIGLDLASMSYVYLVIRASLGRPAAIRYTAWVGDVSFNCMDMPFLPNLIQAFTSTGFEVGSDTHVNNGGDWYYWCVFYQP